MYVDTSHRKTYTRYLLRDSFRKNGKVKHRTIASLSSCSQEEIAAIKLALKHKGDLAHLVSLKQIKTREGLRIGAVYSLKVIADRIGLIRALGNDRQGKLALWQVQARLMDQQSRLRAVRLATSHAVCDVLGLEAFNEDHLYGNLAWLAERQEVIEKRLFRHRYGNAAPQLFLYDVTSSYLEGVQNILAAFGYNRDGKKGKMQLVIGLLTGPEGAPVAVRVFAGNTSDKKTVPEQIRILAESFGVREVTLVGDRGMLKQAQINLLNQEQFHYITAITKPQIEKLLREGVFQMELFEEELAEVAHDGVRYILRRNPERARELASGREAKLAKVRAIVNQKNLYLAGHPRANVTVAGRDVREKIEQLKIEEWVRVESRESILELVIDDVAMKQAAKLDGCYVIKTDLSAEMASAQIVHERYKDLAQVERAFRTFKNGHLEVQPTFVRTEASTRGHVFVVMLAYLVERELEQYWRGLDTTVAEGIDDLGSLRGIELTIGQATCQQVPEPTGLTKQLLDAADIKLPEVLPARKVHVATRKNLVSERS
ncbi:MAG: IS1634 family transposase [Deltaproteobacteria bacterium]|nr:IS1634 family transposase [Deltaproteobacteria bacterium]